MKTFESTLGANLEDMRKRLGLSRREVAEMTGLTSSRVWTIERSTLAQSRSTHDTRRILDGLEAYAEQNPNGKPATNRTRTTTATLRRAVKTALDGVATLAATEEDPLRRAALGELHKQITAATFMDGEKS